MRIAAVTLGLALIVSPALARPSLWDVPAVDKGLMNVGIAHGVRTNCDAIVANKLNGISYVWKLVGHAKEAGYTMKETRAFIDDDVEKAKLRKRVVTHFKAKGLNPDKSNALCEFGKAEITKKKPSWRITKDELGTCLICGKSSSTVKKSKSKGQ